MEEEDDSEDDENVVFAKAREFLEIVKSRSRALEKQTSVSNESQRENTPRKVVQFGVCKTKKAMAVKSDSASITQSQRRKLERVKTPVTSFRQLPTQNVKSEEEKEDSVNKMLEHIRRMPAQETYCPPAVPMVLVHKQTADEDISIVPKHSPLTHDIEFSYLTSDEELTTWKLLRSSPCNCNVFVGNLSYRVDCSILIAAFQPLVAEQEQHHLKVRIVTDSLSGASKGYGFVQFPYRRAAELAFICMQRFEIFGREMQIGWGQEADKKTVESEKSSIKESLPTTTSKKIGAVVYDSFIKSAPGDNFCARKRKRRWDVESSEKDCAKKSPWPELFVEPCDTEKKESSAVGSRRPDFERTVEWLTRAQRAKMVEAVCQNLRKLGVKRHLGVFGIHYEADNSRLFVRVDKTVNEEELRKEFENYGVVEVDINKDSFGLSKGSAIVEYTTSASGEAALKHLHGKVLGGKPLVIKMAEPKKFRLEKI